MHVACWERGKDSMHLIFACRLFALKSRSRYFTSCIIATTVTISLHLFPFPPSHLSCSWQPPTQARLNIDSAKSTFQVVMMELT